MVPWVERPVLDFDLDAPMRRRYAALDDAVVASGRQLLDRVMAEYPAGTGVIADMVRLRTKGRFHAEAKAIAARVGATWRQVILANIAYDMTLAFIGCSTMALATADGPVLARNMDWFPEAPLARSSYTLRYLKAGAPRFIQSGWPGSIGVVTGMGRGFAVALNAVLGPEGTRKTGYPVLLHLRRVLEDAQDFDHARSMLCDTTLATAGLFTLAGTENHQRVVIERSPTKHALRQADGDRPLVATNHYQKLFVETEGHTGVKEIDETTCGRFNALCGFVGTLNPAASVTDEQLLYILSDPSVIQGITAQHIVMRPRQMHLRSFVPARLLENPPDPLPEPAA